MSRTLAIVCCRRSAECHAATEYASGRTFPIQLPRTRISLGPETRRKAEFWLSTWLVPGAQCVAVLRSSMGPRHGHVRVPAPAPARRSSAQSRFRGFRLPGFPYFMQRPHQAVLRTCGHAWTSVAVLRTRSNWSVISGRSLCTIPRFLGFVFSGFRDFLSPHLSRLVRSVFPGSCISGFPYYVVSGYRDIG